MPSATVFHVLSAGCLALWVGIVQGVSAGRSQYGGTFFGTHAFDLPVGYDHGQYDDNGYPPTYYSNNFGPKPRMPGKRSDPGDVDYFDAYYDGHLTNSISGKNKLPNAVQSHRGRNRQAYWRAQRFIPLEYDDFREYQRMRYELGSAP